MRYFLIGLSLFFLSSNPVKLTAQAKQFHGQWNLIGTTYLFEFDLLLQHSSDNKVEGRFEWTVVRYDEHDTSSKDYYQSKLGSSATEFVRGTYDPRTRSYLLRGYKKRDPHQIISTDHYRLKVDDGGHLGGPTQAHGSWKGRINGQAVFINS